MVKNDRRISKLCGVFYCKEKTAYEIAQRLVGSEMCIKDNSKYHT